jgi:hypothetical protein
MAQGQGSSGSGSGGTGQISSLSFIPALLSNAFFGTGIGLDDGGFTTTGLRDFNAGGKAKGSMSSLMDPFGLNQIIGSNPLLGKRNPFNPNNQGGQGGQGSNPFSSFGGPGGQGGQFGGDLSQLFPQNFPGSDANAGIFESVSGVPGLGDLFGGISKVGRKLPVIGGLFGKDKVSPEDQARQRVASLMGYSTEALGLGRGGALNPFDLLSNVMDLMEPGINPGIAGGLAGIKSGELGQLAGNNALFGEGGLSDTFQEGLSTGFKPDLQPVIDEASRAFFSDIVPQLGQQNVAMQEGVGPFSSDLTGQLTNAGGALASQLGSLEVENQNRAADRRGEFAGLSGLITDQLFNAGPNAGRNMMDLGEQFALQGTRGGRQATMLQLLAGMTPSGPIQASSSQNKSKSAGGGLG